jgi:hypothetical protein
MTANSHACCRYVIAIAVALGWPAAGQAQEQVTEHTLTATPGSSPSAASIADLAWLTGTWRGPGFGGVTEEIWSEPRDGAMLGVFRLVREGKPVFYELLLLEEAAGTVVLRVKHFNPDFSGWEQREEHQQFPLIARSGGAFHFSGITFRPVRDSLTVFVAIKQKGEISEHTVQRVRVPASW